MKGRLIVLTRPEWLKKPALVTFAVGWVIGLATMSYGFGYMSPSTAEKMVQTRVVEAVLPLCPVAFAALGPEINARFQKASEYDRESIVRKEMPNVGGMSLDYTNIRDCVRLIAAYQLKTAANTK
jgi:hypothetical protein